MATLNVVTQNLIILSSQVERGLREVHQLLQTFGAIPTDLHFVLTECDSLTKQESLNFGLLSRCLNFLCPDDICFRHLNACKLHLQHAHTTIYEIGQSLRDAKQHSSAHTPLRRNVSLVQKQRLEICRCSLHASSTSLGRAMLTQNLLQALAHVDVRSMVQVYSQDRQSSSQHVPSSSLSRPRTDNIYSETNVSGNARVVQGDLHQTYNYFCGSAPHLHTDQGFMPENMSSSPVMTCEGSRWQKHSNRASAQLQSVHTPISRSQNQLRKTALTFHNESRSSKNLIAAVNQQSRWQALLPLKWLGWVFHLQAVHAYGRWTFNFTVWNILQQNASIFENIERDDLLGFRQLLQSGRYTIYDRDQRGQTLLMHAINEGAMEIVQFLVLHDKSMARECINQSFKDSSDTFCCFILFSCVQYSLESYSRRQSTCDSTDHIAKVLYVLDHLFDIIHDEGLVEEESAWGTRLYIRRPVKQLSVEIGPGVSQAVSHHMTDKLFGENTDMGINSRMGWALYASGITCFWDFWILLGKADLDLACVEAQILKDEGDTILTYCANNLASSLRNETCWLTFQVDASYTKLLRQAFHLNDLERSFSRKVSPLLSVMKSCIAGSNSRNILARVKLVLRHWLSVVDSTGVDLEHYGMQEHEFFKMSETYSFTYLGSIAGIEYQVRLINFQWSKHAHQWEFWFSTSEDEIGNTFMASHLISTGRLPRTGSTKVDQKYQPMPGAWIDESCKEKQSVPLERYLGRAARSRRRRKRYLAAAGYRMCDARLVFGNLPFHDYVNYRPRQQKEDCRQYCSEFSSCY